MRLGVLLLLAGAGYVFLGFQRHAFVVEQARAANADSDDQNLLLGAPVEADIFTAPTLSQVLSDPRFVLTGRSTTF